jgi:hypothetical protein
MTEWVGNDALAIAVLERLQRADHAAAGRNR